MNKYILLIFLIALPICANAQYLPESLKYWNYFITNSTEWPKEDEVKLFSTSTILIVKQEVPEYMAKDSQKNGLRVDEEKAFAIKYNEIIDSLAKQFYPYKVKFNLISPEKFEDLKYNKNGKVFAYMYIYDYSYLVFGLTNKKKALFALPLTDEIRRESLYIESELKFYFDRLENFFKRMEKGAHSSMKTYRKCRDELNKRLEDEKSSKTLVLKQGDLADDLSIEKIDSILDMNFIIVDDAGFDKILLDTPEDYWYVKLLPYKAFGREGTIDYTQVHPKTGYSEFKSKRTNYSSVAHYIIDAEDGAAVLVKFGSSSIVTESILKLWNTELIFTKASIRYKPN